MPWILFIFLHMHCHYTSLSHCHLSPWLLQQLSYWLLWFCCCDTTVSISQSDRFQI
jgi:hypothetical protein